MSSNILRKNMIRLATIFLGLFILFTIILKQLILDYAILQNKKKVENILTTHLAMHQYIEGIQKPVFYELKDEGKLYKEFFDARVLSFTFIARNFHYKFNEIKEQNGESQYYYKLASTNPRNELNTADSYEAKILKRFNEDRDFKKFEAVARDKDGKAYLYYMKPISPNKQSCMRCHGTPSDAPTELLDIYGDKRGFFEKVGDIRAMISIKLPLEQELEDANEFLYLVSAIAFGVMLCIYLIIYYFYKAIIYRDMQIASKTKELEEMAKKDALTGAYNRHYLDSRFADDIDSLGDKTLSVMMIDIDYFKMINDNYGHQEGDKVLIALSKHIQSSLSDDCTFYRYGGEEFLVVLLAHDIDHAYDIAQTLRASIERYVVDNIDITVSIGVSQLIKGDTPDSIIKRADDALYIAKESGRNRVEVKK